MAVLRPLLPWALTYPHEIKILPYMGMCLSSDSRNQGLEKTPFASLRPI